MKIGIPDPNQFGVRLDVDDDDGRDGRDGRAGWASDEMRNDEMIRK